MNSLRTVICISMLVAALPVTAAFAQVPPGPRSQVTITADPGSNYMQPTGSTPKAAKNPPDSMPGNLTPGQNLGNMLTRTTGQR